MPAWLAYILPFEQVLLFLLDLQKTCLKYLNEIGTTVTASLGSFGAIFIIYSSFLGVWESLISFWDLFKLCGIAIGFVWMILFSKFSIRLFNFFLAGIFGNAKHFIESCVVKFLSVCIQKFLPSLSSCPPLNPPKGEPPKLEKKFILINKYYKLIKFILITSLFQRITQYFIHCTEVILLPSEF